MKPQLLNRVGSTVQQISSIESRRVGLYKSISASAGKKKNRGGDGNGQKGIMGTRYQPSPPPSPTLNTAIF